MIENEAIEFMKGYLDANCYTDRCVKAHNIAIKALKKQIPKKPIKSKEQKIRYVNTYYCPTCNLGFTGFNIAKWCYHCGQKIDWRKE